MVVMLSNLRIVMEKDLYRTQAYTSATNLWAHVFAHVFHGEATLFDEVDNIVIMSLCAFGTLQMLKKGAEQRASGEFVCE